jgi:large subunit ribosomal protein L24e
MASLRAERIETERARAELSEKRVSAAQEARQRRIDERMDMLERKREEKYGGKEQLARLRREKAEREAEALLREIMGKGEGRGKGDRDGAEVEASRVEGVVQQV